MNPSLNYLSAFALLFPSIAFAADAPATYTLMAPLSGYLSGSLELSTYLRGAAQILIGIAGILAVIMIVYCGIQLMGTPSASGKSAAKECIWNAVFGILLAIGAWILLYTINPLLLSRELRLGNVAVAPAGGASAASSSPSVLAKTYVWAAGASCEPVRGKLVSAVPPSYCTGSAPSAGSTCCGLVSSPLLERIGTPISAMPLTPSALTNIVPSSPVIATTGTRPSPRTITTATAPEIVASTNLDNIDPTVTISSPQNDSLTTLSAVPVTFTARDDQLLAHIEYVSASPGKAVQVGNICSGSCPSPTATMTVPVPIDLAFPGTHAIEIRACDSRQCGHQTVTVFTEAPCVSTANMACKVLPIGLSTSSPLCVPQLGTAAINVGGNTNAYAFKIDSNTGGGTLRIVGGNQTEYPPPPLLDGGVLCGRNECYEAYYGEGYSYTVCPPNIIPSNIIASISGAPGDLSSTATTIFDQRKRVSGYCGNGGSFGTNKLSFIISANASGGNICTVQKDRTYYLNVSTVPFLSGGNPLYSLFWSYAP